MRILFLAVCREKAERAASGVVVAWEEFFRAHAEWGLTATRSGYNPLLQDFSNTAFFLGSSSRIAEE
jgi:hypothetical protein